MLTRDEIVQQALALTPDDRAYVAELLERSLASGEFATPEIAAAWMAEIERRSEACDRGEMQTEDWRTVMARLEQRHGAAKTTQQ
jgi:putative addiction module component (TIGR02574 family)